MVSGSDKVPAKLDCTIYLNNIKVSEENKNLLERIDRFGKRLKQQIHEIKEQTPLNNMEIIKLGEQSYHFANRLDNMVKLKNMMIAYRDWVNPNFTLAVTFLLSLLIFSPVISTIFICIGGFAFKDSVVNILASLSNGLEFPDKRLIIPPSNIVFLKELMDKYCTTLDYIKAVMADP